MPASVEIFNATCYVTVDGDDDAFDQSAQVCLVEHMSPIMADTTLLYAMQHQLEYEIEKPLRMPAGQTSMSHLVMPRPKSITRR